jgi:hypothetical protein
MLRSIVPEPMADTEPLSSLYFDPRRVLNTDGLLAHRYARALAALSRCRKNLASAIRAARRAQADVDAYEQHLPAGAVRAQKTLWRERLGAPVIPPPSRYLR